MGKKDKRVLPGDSMITITIFRSVVDDSKETKRLENPIKIKDVFPGDDLSNSIISVNGFLQDSEYELADGDICTIRVFPEGSGADWLAGLSIGLTVGLAVVSIIGTGGWAAVAWIAGGAAAGALGFGIASAAGWSVTAWLGSLGMNSQDMKSPDALEGIPQLRGAKNQSNYGKPVPLVLGKHFFTPMYVGNPYSTIGGEDGEYQYFHALYMLGYGKLKVSDVKLGIIGDLASNNTNVQDGFLTFDGDPFLGKPDAPGDPDNPQLELIQTVRESQLYPQAVVEEPLNIELSHVKYDSKNPAPLNQRRLEVVRFSAKNPKKIQVEITLPSGLVEYDDKSGDKKNASVSISVRWQVSQPNNSERWEPFAQFGVGQKDITYTSPVTKITRSKTKAMRFIAEKEFTSYSQVSDAYDTRVIELEIYRTDEQSDKPQKVDKVYLTAIRTWLFDNEKSKKAGTLIEQVPVIDKLRDRTARLGLKIKATRNTQGYLDALNCIVESKCRTWDSATKKWSDSDWDIENQEFSADEETPSNNPAALALKLLQSPSLGRKAYKDSAIDMDSFGEFYEWCESRKFILNGALVTDNQKYTCNGVLTASKRLDEVLALILSTGRATRILNGNKYGLLIDKPRDYPVMVLNSQNVLEASNQKGFDDVPDGFLIHYINDNDGYQYCEEYVMADGSTQPTPDSLIETLELPYITNREQAIKMAWYTLACRHLRPEMWNRKVSVDGYLISIGDMVEVQDDTIAVGIGEGAMITGVIFSPIQDEKMLISEIQTDGKFDVSDITNKQFGIKIMHFDGVHDGIVRTIQVPIPAPGIYSNFTFNPPIELPFLPQEEDIIAFGECDKITTRAICFGKKDNGDGTFEIILVPYQEGIYNTDLGKIPPYQANITTPQQPVQPPVVPEYVEDLHERISEVASRPPDVNSNLYQLMLSISDRILETDNTGRVLAGQLPFTTQATLYKGSDAVLMPIIYYPGTGNAIFDPMLGDFTPVSDIVFSLVNAPSGISVSKNGLITVSQNAALLEHNYITVQAEHEGRIYRTQLYIRLGAYTPQYLGACYEATGTQTVRIKIGNNTISKIAHQGDWVSYLEKTVENSIWEKGAVMRWNGTQWEKVDPLARGDTALYVSALMDICNGAPNTIATSVFCQLLIAQEAFIRELAAEMIRLRENGGIRSEHFLEGTTGFSLQANGRAVFNEELYVYDLKAVSFEIIPPSGSGTIIANLVGFQSQQLSLSVGWYEIEMAGGGGGKGGDGRTYTGRNGGAGGYIKYRFYNNLSNTTIELYSGAGGGNGISGSGSGANGGSGGGGGGGGGSVVKVQVFNILLIAGGGGGGGNSGSVSGGGGGGANGGGGGGAGGVNGWNGNGGSGGAGGGGGNYNGGGGGGGNSSGSNGSGVSGGGGAPSYSQVGIGAVIEGVKIGGDGNSGNGGTSINNFNVANVGGGNNVNGGNGFIRLNKLS